VLVGIVITLIASPGGGQQKTAVPKLQPIPSYTQSAPQQSPSRALSAFYHRWLNEDVRWIITDDEIAAFKKLASDSDRDRFIEQFWKRRDPTPDTEENEYKEEHYRRIFYANEHYAEHVPGWRTDRGRTYIMYGKPDSIDAHPAGGPYQRTLEEGGGQTETYPFEDWRYRYLEGIGTDVEIEFVDTCRCGEYHMTLDRSEKESIAHPARAIAGKIAPVKTPAPPESSRPSHPPVVRFKDLAAIVDTKTRNSALPFDVEIDYA